MICLRKRSASARCSQWEARKGRFSRRRASRLILEVGSDSSPVFCVHQVVLQIMYVVSVSNRYPLNYKLKNSTSTYSSEPTCSAWPGPFPRDVPWLDNITY